MSTLGIPNLPLHPNIGQNSDGDISDFQISGQYHIKENCHNSRTTDDIDMKLGSVTKLDKRKKITYPPTSKQTPKKPTQNRVKPLL